MKKEFKRELKYWSAMLVFIVATIVFVTYIEILNQEFQNKEIINEVSEAAEVS